MTHLQPLHSAAAALCLALSAVVLPAQEGRTRDRDRSPPVAGRVLDAEGQPSADTWVYLVWRSHPELPAGFAACLGDEPYHTEIAVTDARGRFGIDPDGYWPMAMYARTKDGATAPLQFPVLPGDFVELVLRPPATVRGVVLHAGTRDRPAQGYAVEARVSPELPKEHALWGFDVAGLLPFVRFHTRTDAYGKFELTVPADSRTRVGVRSLDTVLWTDDPTEITLPPAQPLALQLRCGGAPVAGARAHDLSAPARPRRADDRGMAMLSNLGTSPILVVGDRHQPVLIAPTDTGGPISLKKGDQLRGRLVRRFGTPIAKARLVFGRPFSQGPRQLRWQFAAWAEQCDDEGRFDFGWVERGVPLVGYVEVDGRFECFLLRVPEGPLDLGDIPVSNHYQLRGAVTSPDRTPANGAWVFYRPALPGGGTLENAAVELSLSQVVMTGRGGRFLIEDLMPGPYRVVVRQRGSQPQETLVFAKTEAEATPFQLAPSPAVRGVVVDGDGRPVPGINVALQQDLQQFAKATRRFGDPPVQLSTHTAGDGTFEFVDLPAGVRFDLRAFGNHGGRMQHAEQRDVPLAGEPLRLVLQ